MRERRKTGIHPVGGPPLRILELGIYRPEDLRAHLMPFWGRGDWETEKAAFLNSRLYWGSMPFIPWLEAFDDRSKTPEDIERIEEHKRKTIAADKRYREKTADAMLSRGALTAEQAARMESQEPLGAGGGRRPATPEEPEALAHDQGIAWTPCA